MIITINLFEVIRWLMILIWVFIAAITIAITTLNASKEERWMVYGTTALCLVSAAVLFFSR